MKKFKVTIFMLFSLFYAASEAQTQYSAVAGASPHLVKTGRYSAQDDKTQVGNTSVTKSSTATTAATDSDKTIAEQRAEAGENIKAGAHQATEGIKELGKGVGKAASKSWKNVKKKTPQVLEKVGDGVSKGWENAGKGARKMGQGAGNFFQKLGKGISGSFKNDSTDAK